MRMPVTLPAMRTLFALPLLLLPFFAACGDDDDGETPGLSPLPSATTSDGSATPGATVVPTPDPDLPFKLAESPAYVLYEVSRGDSIDSVAAAFAVDADEIAEVNGLAAMELAAGQFLAIPLHPDPGLLMPVAALVEALGLDDADATLQLLSPSGPLRDGYLGRVALARARTASPDSVDGPGYVLEFYFTDRAVLKGGVPDPDARFTDPAFTIGGGSLAPDLLQMSGRAYGAFPLEGAAYAIVTYDETQMEPSQIWESLEPAP